MEFLSSTIGNLSPSLEYKLAYFHNRRKFPNLNQPTNLSEIIGHQILKGENCTYAPYVDKIGVRNYIQDWGLGNYLPKLYGVWDSFDEIDFNNLPNQFALKTNHGCGNHVIVFDKEKLNIDLAKRTIGDALKFRGNKLESQYSLIRPRIYAEELICEKIGELPEDYKFHTCNHIIKGVLVVAERTDDYHRVVFYDRFWTKMNIIKANATNKQVEKPAKFEEMLNIAQIIANKFYQVRVDLYYVHDKIYIGELTFTPQGGQLRNFSLEGLRYLGIEKDWVF